MISHVKTKGFFAEHLPCYFLEKTAKTRAHSQQPSVSCVDLAKIQRIEEMLLRLNFFIRPDSFVTGGDS